MTFQQGLVPVPVPDHCALRQSNDLILIIKNNNSIGKAFTAFYVIPNVLIVIISNHCLHLGRNKKDQVPPSGHSEAALTTNLSQLGDNRGDTLQEEEI